MSVFEVPAVIGCLFQRLDAFDRISDSYLQLGPLRNHESASLYGCVTAVLYVQCFKFSLSKELTQMKHMFY